MSPLTEMQLRQRQLKAFMDAEPVWVKLLRPQNERTASGGRRKTADLQLRPQRFRIIPFKRRLTIEHEFSGEMESIRNIVYILLGDVDADLEIGDYFSYQGNYYEVKFISKRLTDRKVAGVITRNA